MNANHCKFHLSLEEGKNKFLFIKINAIWYLHQGISAGMWLEEELKMSFIKCKRKQKEFLKTTCKHPDNNLTNSQKAAFNDTHSTRKAKDNYNIFTKTEWRCRNTAVLEISKC